MDEDELENIKTQRGHSQERIRVGEYDGAGQDPVMRLGCAPRVNSSAPVPPPT
jgi:hypothetical protein